MNVYYHHYHYCLVVSVSLSLDYYAQQQKLVAFCRAPVMKRNHLMPKKSVVILFVAPPNHANAT
jgi:hypothetical protein